MSRSTTAQGDDAPPPAGIAVCVGMASTFAYANSTLRHQVSLRVNKAVRAETCDLGRSSGSCVVHRRTDPFLLLCGSSRSSQGM